MRYRARPARPRDPGRVVPRRRDRSRPPDGLLPPPLVRRIGAPILESRGNVGKIVLSDIGAFVGRRRWGAPRVRVAAATRRPARPGASIPQVTSGHRPRSFFRRGEALLRGDVEARVDDEHRGPLRLASTENSRESARPTLRRHSHETPSARVGVVLFFFIVSPCFFWLLAPRYPRTMSRREISYVERTRRPSAVDVDVRAHLSRPGPVESTAIPQGAVRGTRARSVTGIPRPPSCLRIPSCSSARSAASASFHIWLAARRSVSLFNPSWGVIVRREPVRRPRGADDCGSPPPPRCLSDATPLEVGPSAATAMTRRSSVPVPGRVCELPRRCRRSISARPPSRQVLIAR